MLGQEHGSPPLGEGPGERDTSNSMSHVSGEYLVTSTVVSRKPRVIALRGAWGTVVPPQLLF